MNISDRILDNHVLEFSPRHEILEQYQSAYRLSIAGVVESRRNKDGSRRRASTLGDTWKPLNRIPTRYSGVLRVGMYKDKQVRSLPVKELVVRTWIRQLRIGEWVRCIDGDEANVNLCNLSIEPDKYARHKRNPV